MISLFRFAFLLLTVLLTCILPLSAQTPPAISAADSVVWTAAPGALRELPDSAEKFRLATGEQLTILAKVRRPAGMKGDGFIVQTPGWSFGIKSDGALGFGITGIGNRFSVPPPSVPPLWVAPATPWPPASAKGGKVPADEWTEVGWTVDTRGDWGSSFTFYLNRTPVPADQGFGPFAVPVKPGPVRIGGGVPGGLEIAEVRVIPRRLTAAEIAESGGSGSSCSHEQDRSGYFGLGSNVTVNAAAVPAWQATNTSRLIIAHRMIGFGPTFGGSQAPGDLANGAYGFLFPARKPDSPNFTGWCRDGHIGALHPPFASAVEAFKWEIAQALAGGVNAFVFDTCGGLQDLPIPDQMIQAAEELGGTFKVGLCFDFAGGSQEKKVESLRAWMQRHRASPALLRIQGRPAFVSYMCHRKAEDVSRWFKEFREAAGEPIFLHQDFCEFPLFGKNTEEWTATVQPYLDATDGIGCFFSRCGIKRDAEAFRAMSAAAHKAGKLWGMSPWPNYYAPGRSCNLENIGADNSRLWDQMWRLAFETRADYVLLTTWNDITEETIVMPSVRKHFTFVDLLANYYGPWYRTGTEPAPDHDQVYLFYRPYRTDAAAPLITGPRAQGCAAQDSIEVRAFLTAPGTIVLAGIGEKEVPAGMSSTEFPARPGALTVALVRQPQRLFGLLPLGGPKTILQFTAPEPITDRPWRQDFALRGFSSEEAGHWAQWFPGPPNWLSEYGDFDRNGLPNWFERYYFGCWQGTAPAADPDGDGKTNVQEFQAGTDPRKPPAVYPAGYSWDAAKDFRVNDETCPIPDSLGAKVWEFEFMTQTGHPALPRTSRFAPASQLVPQIPAWLEWGGSWGFGIGSPKDGTLLLTGEADSAAALAWTSPVTGKVACVLTLGKVEQHWATGVVTVSLTREGESTPLWTAEFNPKNEPPALSRELELKQGDRLRLATAGPAGGPRWAVHVAWKLTVGGIAATGGAP